MYQYENELYENGINFIAGVDEVGRGPLNGPVVSACVVLPKGYHKDGIIDSKKLSEKKRNELFDIIKFFISDKSSISFSKNVFFK